MAPSIGLALVLYEHAEDDVARALAKWGCQSEPPAATYLVANSPGTSLSRFATSATVLEPNTNLGFTGGVNLAARSAWNDGHTHLLLANLDVEILSRDLVSGLLGVFAAHPDCTFASPGIVMWPETWRVWYRGAHVSRPAWIARQPGLGRAWNGSSRGQVRTGYFSGCCALVDLERFMSLDGFDESLFMYYDEAELAERATQRGWHSWLLDEPLLAHAKQGRALGQREAYWHARNSAALLRRHEHGPRYLAGRITQLAVTPAQLLRCDSQGARTAYLAGLRSRAQETRRGISRCQ